MKKRVLIASWSFIIGSALFTTDGIFQLVNQFSITSLLHLSGSILFLGGLPFIPVALDLWTPATNIEDYY